MVEAGGDHRKVLLADESGGEGRGVVAESTGVSGHGGLLDVIAGLGADKEALVAYDGVKDSADVAARGVVKESAGVDVGLTEGQVELLDGGAGLVGVPQVLELGLDGLRQNLIELDLGVEECGSSPALGDGDTWWTLEPP